jgi:midasin (ATPase involved in ribosome maturation)
VVEAMERGAILLLDEIDLASNKIMCLQSILEGKGTFLKKIGKTEDDLNKVVGLYNRTNSIMRWT